MARGGGGGKCWLVVGGRAGEDASGGCVDRGKWPLLGMGENVAAGSVSMPRRCGGVAEPIMGVSGVSSVCRGPRGGGLGGSERRIGICGSGRRRDMDSPERRRGVDGSEWRKGIGSSERRRGTGDPERRRGIGGPG